LRPRYALGPKSTDTFSGHRDADATEITGTGIAAGNRPADADDTGLHTPGHPSDARRHMLAFSAYSPADSTRYDATDAFVSDTCDDSAPADHASAGHADNSKSADRPAGTLSANEPFTAATTPELGARVGCAVRMPGYSVNSDDALPDDMNSCWSPPAAASAAAVGSDHAVTFHTHDTRPDGHASGTATSLSSPLTETDTLSNAPDPGGAHSDSSADRTSSATSDEFDAPLFDARTTPPPPKSAHASADTDGTPSSAATTT
jgi:hypothetical protein